MPLVQSRYGGHIFIISAVHEAAFEEMVAAMEAEMESMKTEQTTKWTQLEPNNVLKCVFCH